MTASIALLLPTSTPGPGAGSGSASPARDAAPGFFARELEQAQASAAPPSPPPPFASQPAPKSSTPSSPPSPPSPPASTQSSKTASEQPRSPDEAADGEAATAAGTETPALDTAARSSLARARALRLAQDRAASGGAPAVDTQVPDAGPTRDSVAEPAPDSGDRGPAIDPAVMAFIQAHAAQAAVADGGSAASATGGARAGAEPALDRIAPAKAEASDERSLLAAHNGSAQPEKTSPGTDASASGAAALAIGADAADARSGRDNNADSHDTLAGFKAASGEAALPGTSPLPSAELSGFASALARAQGNTTTAPPPATELRLATPVLSPEFVPRLSGELAVLARDGVQEARVQVNPLELGPIAVQITLDGNQAQVHLAADNAQTRELLEQAMPTLAAALRESGLTLTGGGVSQQARQHGQNAQHGQPPAAGSGRGNGDETAATPTVTRTTHHLGAVDLYA